MKKVVSFGEIMMRLNPQGYLKLRQAQSLEVSFAGGEANVAVSIANFGMQSEFVSKLPDNDLGHMAEQELRKYQVGTENIIYGGPRLGVYYVEKGVSQRPSKVLYDRANSSIALAQRSDFDWDRILDGCNWFHFTGITPALGNECAEICEDALKICRKNQITVSCDLNFRKKLWSEEEANKVMGKLKLSHRPHDTRHTFITLAKDAGMDEYIIKLIVGHSIEDVTEKVYTHRTMEQLHTEIEKIE